MSPLGSEFKEEAENVVKEPTFGHKKRSLIWARQVVDDLTLESCHCAKTIRMNFVAMKRHNLEEKLVCEKRQNKMKPNEAICRVSKRELDREQNEQEQQFEFSEKIWLIERQRRPSRVMEEEKATHQTRTIDMEQQATRQDKSRTMGGLISARRRRISLNAISTKSSIIVCISLALLVLIGRTSGLNNDNINKPASSSLQQLAKIADVELSRSRGLQRLQRDTVGGNNSSTSGPGVPPTCGYPGSPAHASVTFNTTSHVGAGTAATYTCDNGYELLGPPRRICQPNGTWAPIGIPFCVLNVGLGKAAMQSSVAGQQQSAQKAVDGSTSPYYQPSTCTMTDVETNPWWYVNLLEPYLVQIVRIDFGMACCANRQKAIVTVRVGNNRPDLGNNPVCNRYHGFIEEGKPLFLPCTRPAPGAFVSIHLESPTGSALSICETFIYTDHALSIEQCPSFREQPLGSTATYNGKCYLFHNNQALTFESARKLCEIRGGTLVDETSPALQGFLSWELYRRHRNDQLMGQYWLGAVRDPRQAQNWKWINGRDVQVSFWNSLGQNNCSRFDGSKGWLWSDTDCQSQLNFICQFRPLSCGKPEKPTNSTLITRNVDNGTVIEYQCAPGNLLMGPKSRTCLPTGFFSEFAPKCKYLDCQFPAQIANGDYKLLNSSTSYQSMVTYFCQDGHQLYGRPTLTCDVDERWNGPPPRCEPLLCPAPIAPQNGHVTVTSNITTPGTQATYECRPGYELVGEHLLSCLRTGSWDQSFPYCREKRHTASAAAAAAATAMAAATAASPSAKPASGPRQQTQTVQFPGAPAATSFSSNRVVPAANVSPSPPTPGIGSTPTSVVSSSSAAPNLLSASLNGLASQQQQPAIGQQQPPVSGNEISPSLGSGQNLNEIQKSRKPAASSSNVNSFVSAPTSATSAADSLNRGDQDQQQQRGGPSRPQTPNLSRPLGPQRSPQLPTSSSTAASNAASRFTFNPIHSTTTSTSLSPIAHNFDTSNQLATTNSISIHQQISSGSSSTTGQPQLVSASSDPSTLATGLGSSTTASSPAGGLQTTSSGATSGQQLSNFANQQHHQHNQPPPVRASSHNSMANAKNSLDGIIAVAIFGGFIFLGAIITILVIIIRSFNKRELDNRVGVTFWPISNVNDMPSY